MNWQTVIGLEVHAQLNTKTKLFSGAATKYGANSNSQACAIDLAMPGSLPILNKAVLELAIHFGLSINAEINQHSIFERKNYFYPDLPKGYQISQFAEPIIKFGFIDIKIDENYKRIGITRAHLEEDAGKSIHDLYPYKTGIDLNRAGTPLLEIVSEPDLNSAQEAIAYLKELHTLLRYLEVCDGNMQEGSFRVDANVSVRKKVTDPLGVRVEIKNLNSFRFIEQAINYEISRQIEQIESGNKIVQETRLFDSNKGITQSMREKEDSDDYRYFPDPDLLPVIITKKEIHSIKEKIPELPQAKILRYQNEYGLKEQDAIAIASDLYVVKYFEQLLANNIDAKIAANWLLTEVFGKLNKDNLDIKNTKVSANELAELLVALQKKQISGKAAKEVFSVMWQKTGFANAIIDELGYRLEDNTEEVISWIQDVIAEYSEQVKEYNSGKVKILGFLVGQVLKKAKGKADPAKVNELMKIEIKNN